MWYVCIAIAALVALDNVAGAAVIAAVGTLANTWLLLRHDNTVKEMRKEVRRLRKLAAQRRKATRSGDTEIVVIDPDEMEHIVGEMESEW